jgi:VWFA-related protein
MLDVSGSMRGNLPLLRTGANELFNRLRPDDLVRVGTFGELVEISPTFTNDPEQLRAAVPTEIRGGATPLWKGIDQAMSAFAGIDGRRVVLVISDGSNTNPPGFGRIQNPLEVIDRAEREDFLVYAIGVPPLSAAVLSQPNVELSEVVLKSGGGYTELRRRDDLGAAFARIADELHRQYLLGFVPTQLDGKLHKLEVRVKNGDLTPRARKSYLAPKKAS